MEPGAMDLATFEAMLEALVRQQAVTPTIRFVALASATAIFVAVLEAVRRRKLREELTPIWITCALAILALSLSFDLLLWLTQAIGAWTGSSTVFFFGLLFLMAISLHYAVRISTLSNQVKTLAQELALLKLERSQAPPRDAAG